VALGIVKIAPGLLIGCVIVLLVGCSTAANRRQVYAPYQQPTVWDNAGWDWESKKNPNEKLPHPFNQLPILDPTPAPPEED